MTLNDFEPFTIELEDDYEGRVIASLLRSTFNQDGNPVILYVHGYNDYFFHPHVAEAVHEAHYNFYALDLRKYGRSLLPHQHPNYCRDVNEYYEDINEAIKIIRNNHTAPIILLGHSTGGLICSMYMNFGELRHEVHSLVLNSPFFEFNVNSSTKFWNLLAAKAFSFFMPYANKRKPLSLLYTKSIHKKYYGEWDFKEEWKPERGFPAYFKWLIAIHEAQNTLKEKSDIKVPVLVMHSEKSKKPRKWDPEILGMDIVLNIEHIKEIGKKLGKKVTFLPIKKGMHDIFLSKKDVRDQAFSSMITWLNKVIK